MRAFRWAGPALVGALTLLSACGKDERPSITGPTADVTTADGGPELAVYGLGWINRAVGSACNRDQYRQFDFWLGQWNIFNPAEVQTGTSVISRDLDGCVITEDFIGSGGGAGMSLNAYDAATGKWYQTFVDNLIGNFRISGGLVGDEMVMTGLQPIFQPGVGVVDRDTKVTWTPNADGSVHQVVENSFDGGPVQTGFDGLYIPATDLNRATPNTFSFCRLFPASSDLDFWQGDWSVAAEQNGLDLGTSHVEKKLNDCLVQEDFQTPRGYKNRSYMFYDFVVDTWFRTFMDNDGQFVRLSGGQQDGKMVFTGDDVAPGGATFQLRVTIESAGPGRVRQTWEVSHDDGVNWIPRLVLDYTQS
jgi:hypothetical protein